MNRSTRRIALLAAAVTVAATLPAAAVSHACKGDPSVAQSITTTVDGQSTTGLFALPAKPPKALVVFAHGYSHTVESWRPHITRTATNDGIVAVAMNYRGDVYVPPSAPGGLPSSRGWQVSEGAQDSIAAAKHFLNLCPTIKTVVMYGVSMGGNTAGLALAAGATRANGAPLFDYWINVEGASNVSETYQEARLVAQSGNTFAKNATEDIERQMGGTFEEVPETYLERSVVTRADDIAASGLRGAIFVHGLDDGLVPYNQSREMVTLLHQVGVPTEMFTVVTRQPGTEPGTTLTGTALGPTGQYESPFAGHASEASQTHTVGMRGFAALTRILSGDTPICGEHVIDGATNTALTVRGTYRGPEPVRICTR